MSVKLSVADLKTTFTCTCRVYYYHAKLSKCAYGSPPPTGNNYYYSEVIGVNFSQFVN